MSPRIVRAPAGAPPVRDAIDEAVRVLGRGGLVVLPTETVYGLAADPRDPEAMARLGAAKGRDAGKPVALLIAGLEHIESEGGRLAGCARRLAERLWPGPLTLVIDTPRGPTGFRWPDHPFPQAVVRAFGRPVAATSANRSGGPDALTAGAAVAALGDAVDLVVDGGPVPGGVPSTVVRVTGAGIEILREGAIPAAHIRGLASPHSTSRVPVRVMPPGAAGIRESRGEPRMM